MRRFSLYGPVFILALVAGYFVDRFSGHWYTLRWYLVDEGRLLYVANKLLQGLVPHVSFPYRYAGGYEVILSLFFSIFGPDWLVARAMLVVSMAAMVVVSVRIMGESEVRSVEGTVVVALAVCGSYMIHFLIYPAWHAQTLVLAGILVLASGRKGAGGSHWVAGVLFGLACSLKQNTGILALLGLLAYLALGVDYLANTRLPPARGSAPRRSGWNWQGGLLALTSLFPPIGILALVRHHMSVLNMILFLLVPLALAGATFVLPVREGAFEPHALSLRLRSYVRYAGVSIFGFCCGLMPLALYFTIKGGLFVFIEDAFLQVQSSLPPQFVGFTSSSLLFPGSLVRTVRNISEFGLPIFATVVGFCAGFRLMSSGSRLKTAKVLLLLSAELAYLSATMYPLPMRMYVVYLLPMAMLILVTVGVLVLTSKGIGAVGRSAVLGGMLVCLPLVQLGPTYFTKRVHSKTALLDPLRGNVLVQERWPELISPVVAYLRARPKVERMVAFDVNQDVYAFLTDRQLVVDYDQRLMIGGPATTEELGELAARALEQEIEIVIVGKKEIGSTTKAEWFKDQLSSVYSIALEDSAHFIFQHRSTLAE